MSEWRCDECTMAKVDLCRDHFREFVLSVIEEELRHRQREAEAAAEPDEEDD